MRPRRSSREQVSGERTREEDAHDRGKPTAPLQRELMCKQEKEKKTIPTAPLRLIKNFLNLCLDVLVGFEVKRLNCLENISAILFYELIHLIVTSPDLINSLM